MKLEAPPIRVAAFLAQTCDDEEYLRPHPPGNPGFRYSRGKHGGFDFQDGTNPAEAVWSGRVHHVDFGSPLGEHQFVIVGPEGFGAFYAHTSTRPKHGVLVEAGDPVGLIGHEGTVADHLHFEVLKDPFDWFSSANAGPALRRLQARLRLEQEQEEENMALDDYIRGHEACVRKVKELNGRDPGNPRADQPAHWQAGWQAARFAANHPRPAPPGPVAKHRHPVGSSGTTGDPQ